MLSSRWAQAKALLAPYLIFLAFLKKSIQSLSQARALLKIWSLSPKKWTGPGRVEPKLVLDLDPSLGQIIHLPTNEL